MDRLTEAQGGVRNSRGQVTGEAVLIVLAAALAIFVGTEVVNGVKTIAHKTKCGVVRLVGKHCEPPPAPPAPHAPQP